MGKDLVRGQLHKVLALEFFSQRYEFVQLIGNGAFGIVLEVLSKELGHHIALKVIPVAGTRSKLEKWAKSELFVHDKLSHPHIVALKGYKRCEDYFFLELELVRGGNMSQLLEKPLEEGKLANLIKQVLGALEYLHWKGIVHRDIKPQNILLDDSQSPKYAKVGDFGVSGVAHPLFHEGFRAECGTEGFKAPEQLARSVYGKSVDMWSLGILVYMLLQAGRHPFPKGEMSSTEYLGWVKQSELVWNDPQPSEMAQDFVSRLLRFDEFDRYAAYEAKKHPWVGDLTAPIPLKFSQKVSIEDTKRKLKNTLIALAMIRMSKDAKKPVVQGVKEAISDNLSDFSSALFITEHESAIFRTLPTSNTVHAKPPRRPTLTSQQRSELNITNPANNSHRTGDSHPAKPMRRPTFRGSKGSGEILQNIHQILMRLEALPEPDRTTPGPRVKSLTRTDKQSKFQRQNSSTSMHELPEPSCQKQEGEEVVQQAFRLKRGVKLTSTFRNKSDKADTIANGFNINTLQPKAIHQQANQLMGYSVKPSIIKKTLRRTSSIFDNKENDPFELARFIRMGAVQPPSRLSLAGSKSNLHKPPNKVLQEQRN